MHCAVLVYDNFFSRCRPSQRTAYEAHAFRKVTTIRASKWEVALSSFWLVSDSLACIELALCFQPLFFSGRIGAIVCVRHTQLLELAVDVRCRPLVHAAVAKCNVRRVAETFAIVGRYSLPALAVFDNEQVTCSASNQYNHRYSSTQCIVVYQSTHIIACIIYICQVLEIWL